MESGKEGIKNVSAIVVGALIIVTGIAGNLLVVIVVWKKRSLRSTANYLLVNLAISDITSLGFFPLMVIGEGKFVKLEQGTLSDLLCKFIISYHIPLAAKFTSTLTLVVLSVERYHAIVKPMRTRIRLREDTVKYAIIAVWIGATMLALPLFIFGKYGIFWNKMMCNYSIKEENQVPYSLLLLVFLIFIPFFVISFCYFQIIRELYFKNKVGPQNIAAQEDVSNKRKLVKLSISITTAFMFCFFPAAVTVILKALDKERFGNIYNEVFILLVVLQSALNPLLYTFQSTNFRQAFKEMLKFNFRCYG